MKAIFSPGPSYSDLRVRQTAGWVHILDLYREGLEELGYEVFVPQVPPELIDGASTVSKITSYDLVAAQQLPLDADLFLGPPGYSLAQILRLRGARDANYEFIKPLSSQSIDHCRILTYVWNNADWWRDEQLAEEYKKFGAAYDLSPSWRWINKTALQMSDHVISCSPWVKKTHAKVVPDKKISITFWGVDSQRFHPAEAEREPDVFRVLFVGSDPIRKGLWYLIEALRELDSTLQPYELWIVGCAPIQNPPPHWRQFGMVPHEQMPEIYRQCSVLVCPTLEDGIALCVQEAMASGLPVITSSETAEVFINRPGEAFGGNRAGFKVNYRDILGISNALQVLHYVPDIRCQMGRAARALAVAQTWAQTKEDFKAVILRVMSGSSMPFESYMPWLGS